MSKKEKKQNYGRVLLNKGLKYCCFSVDISDFEHSRKVDALFGQISALLLDHPGRRKSTRKRILFEGFLPASVASKCQVKLSALNSTWGDRTFQDFLLPVSDIRSDFSIVLKPSFDKNGRLLSNVPSIKLRANFSGEFADDGEAAELDFAMDTFSTSIDRMRISLPIETDALAGGVITRVVVSSHGLSKSEQEMARFRANHALPILRNLGAAVASTYMGVRLDPTLKFDICHIHMTSTKELALNLLGKGVEYIDENS